MASQRTQIYLTDEQREALDEVTRAQERSLADVIREAVDLFLGELAPDPDSALRETFGSEPGFEIPRRADWDRRG